METIIVVDNLTCGSCASSIKKNLQKIEGVNAVAVNVDASEVSLLHNVGVSKREILNLLSDLGYPERVTASVQLHKAHLSRVKQELIN